MSGHFTLYPNPSLSSNPSVGTSGATVPTSATLVGGVNAGFLVPLSVDSSGNLNVTVTGSSGLATSANQTTEISKLTSIDNKVPALGQALAAASVPIVLTAAQLTTLTPLSSVTVSGTVTANAGTNLNTSALNLEATQSAMSAKLPATLGQKAMAASMAVALASDQASIPVAATLAASSAVIGHVINDAGSAVIGKVGIDQTTPGTTNLVALAANQSVNVAQINGVAPLMGNGVTGTGSMRVTIASDTTSNTNPFLVNQSQINGVATLAGAGPAGTGSQRVTLSNVAAATLANVAGSATTVTVLASAAARLGAAFFNESTAVLYLKFGATASVTSYTVQIAPGGYYELPGPNFYSGIIDGIWSAANGNVRVTSW